ncbi:hypothetical protein Acr_10g0006920 [Actinidia rufa]|uniref:CCHC-type domain-containing protein n=1 Tax=Actinidia rufa TaxID=165716 RepID=A0A7J0FBP7_9ERIC|nr:hypothetical protein Acr_10g0006920 [Actinidia rufa]
MPDPMAAESWLLGIERVFEVLPCTDEQKVVFATFMFEGAALIWWQLKKPLEPLWLWPRFLEVFNEEYFPEMVRDQKIQEFLNLKQGNMIVVVYNAKFMELSRYAPHIVSTESRKARRFEAGLRWNIKNKVKILRLPTHQEVLHAALIAEESLNEISQFRNKSRKKRIGGNVSRGQSSKRQSSGSSSGNSSASKEIYRACYGCGQEGHQIRDCPMKSKIQGAGTSASASIQQPPAERRNNQPRQGRALHLYQEIPQLPHQLCQGAAEPEDRVDRIERILEGLVQIVHDVHNNNNHDDAPQQPAIPVPEAGAMPRTTIKQFQQLKPPTFYGMPDPMAVESWLLGIERVFEVLPCTNEQKVVFATFMFEGAALIWWQLKKPLEPLRLWPRFLEVFNEEYFPEMNLARLEGLKLDYDGTSRISRKKRIGGNVSRGQSSKRQSSGSSSGNSSVQQRNSVSQGSSRSNELPTCPTCQKKHWGECRMGSRACYGCGQEGHQIRDCPTKSKIQGAGTSASASIQQPPAERRNNQPRQGRAFALVPGNTPATTSVVSVLFDYLPSTS